MDNLQALVCRECGHEYPVTPEYVCERCFGPLEVSYDYDAAAALLTRRGFAGEPRSLWRYAPLLPAPEETRIDLGTGMTRLRDAPRLAAELGLKRVWLKNDASNPTHSFKDRVVSVALSVARHFGYEVAACASTGNLANSVAAHAAATGMRSIVFIPQDLEEAKLAASCVYGGDVIEVEGSYDDANRLCAELAGHKHWAFVNVNFRPYYAEGSKTLAFEIAEQLGWREPDAIVAPVAGGALVTKLAKGMRELFAVGLLDEEPHASVFGAQAEGCAPVAAAFAAGLEDVRPIKAATVARSLAIGNPADGRYALQEARATGGAIASVPESEVAEGMRLLARTEGVFTETAGGVVVSALEHMARTGKISPSDETVVLLTGTGLKTIEALYPVHATHHIRPTVAELERVLDLEPALLSI